jgi:hypothetical protein
MGVLELIQQKAFLGKEFLTWLWYCAESHGKVEPDRAKPIQIEILDPIVLDAQYGDTRAGTFKGDSPATSPEARTALIEGKKLRKARIKWTRASAEWIATIDGENFNVSGLSVPAPGRLPFEDLIALRMEMVTEFEQVIGELFETFLALRLDEGAWAAELTEIQQWVKEK